MKFSPYVTDLLKQKSNRDFRLPSDCEYLALDVESVTGEHIGVNTLKRLLGFIDDEREPRISTLDVIARYLGFDNWDVLSIYDSRSNSSFESSAEEIRSKLKPNDQLTITHIVQGYPLLVSEVIRDGMPLGSFTAGKAQGISFKIL